MILLLITMYCTHAFGDSSELYLLDTGRELLELVRVMA